VSFNLRGHRASGNVNGSDKCESFVPVYIQRRSGGDWRALDTTATRGNGRYSTWVPRKPGPHRAVVKKLTLADGTVCKRDVSPLD
jgi:hypothetical protein